MIILTMLRYINSIRVEMILHSILYLFEKQTNKPKKNQLYFLTVLYEQHCTYLSSKYSSLKQLKCVQSSVTVVSNNWHLSHLEDQLSERKQKAWSERMAEGKKGVRVYYNPGRQNHHDMKPDSLVCQSNMIIQVNIISSLFKCCK